MNTDAIVAIVSGITAAIVVGLLFQLRKVPRIYITDYMSGVRFVRGKFVDVLGPGGHQPLSRHEHVEVVDMRPVPFVLESIAYRDALQNDSVISIGAELLVDDPYLSATSLRHPISDSLPIVRETLRASVSRSIADRSLEYRAKIAGDIQDAANQELGRVGMKVSHLEVTEMFSRSAQPQRITKGLN